MQMNQRSAALLNRTLQIIVLGYQALAIVVFIAGIILGNRWLQTPFIGAFFEHTMVFNGVGPEGEEPPEPWALYGEVQLGDQLVAVNDQPVKNTSEVLQALDGFFPGETIPITFRDTAQQEHTLEVTLHAFPPPDHILYFYIPSGLSLLFLVFSLWIFGLRRTEAAGRAFSVFASSLAIATGSTFDLYTTHTLTYFWTLGTALTGGSIITLAMTFPQESRIVISRPYLRWVGLILAFLLALNAFSTLFDFENPTAYIVAWQIIYALAGLSGLAYILVNLYWGIYAQSPVVKTQARTILFGAVAAFGPMSIWFLLKLFIQSLNFSPYLLIFVLILPIITGYTILRFRFLRTDDFLRRGVTYGLLTILVVGGYAAIVTGFGVLLSMAIPFTSPLWIGAFLFVVAVTLEPIRSRLQGFVDSTFFRGQRVYAERLTDFSHQLTTALDLDAIGAVIRNQIVSILTPDRIHVYTYDSLNDQYAALSGNDRHPTSDIRFSSSSPLARYFGTEKLPLYLDGASSLPPSLQTEQSRLMLLGARLFVVLPGKERPGGWLALGARLSGQPYAPRDLTFLENLGDQASVAIERVQTVANLERRILEMNALTRVSQGVNVTLTFDDVLELIYAQTAQIIPISHLHITLHNKTSDYYYHGFCVENNERLPERENLPFSHTTSLGPEVIRKGRPIMTQDYLRECQARNLTPALESVFAWMGVPLNAGAETIGALSIGSRDGGTAYTRGQLELLQAIADQTAGAIVKSRLLLETQQRARQLTTLNEVTRQLTSTLEIEPLLQNILENAVGILNCEAGSLFLIDEETDELIFRVTVGPVAANLVGQRLPPGTGIVGRAVQSRAPVLENEVQRSPNWFNTDKQTGFTSRSLMAIPLQVKDRIIGVVEVINRRDGLPFVEDDQTLLTAFAGQAAVAIENARLYTLTDQELATRVEELSVMQRIARELNASLEMDRAMRITLDWALRQSRAEAGLIGVLEEGKLRIMSQQGYDDILANLPDQTIKIELPAMLAAVETKQPQRGSVADSKDKLLPTAHSQMIIPIQRESQVIGLILLESSTDTQVDLTFLNRLSDTAAIAISNAQLYGEVQRANLAKSEFVSFVAHELKNPMTSIKGYTELLSAGAVGQINEMQTNFLNTIRSNVERMSTLVSDLNDNAKIEAGRLRLDFKATSVPDLVDEVIRSTRRQIEDKKQTLEIKMDSELPLVWADRTRVGQVLTNLVSNAFKYTPEGGNIIMGAQAGPNLWDDAGAPRVVHLWVKDSGIGISTEDQTKIFQKFFRSDDSKAREAPGTGLGLNITKGLVEMQGGRIWFESEFRKGTTFHFTIPVAEG
jgi:signal transduction histidine kinase/putative methionine-R-sulfoxide reductase with GAF domain